MAKRLVAFIWSRGDDARSHTPEITDAQKVAYHMAEFEALKKEIVEETKETYANRRYAMTASAAITTLLLTWAGQGSRILGGWPFKVLPWLPLGIAIMLAGMSWRARNRSNEKGRYLLQLEDVFRFRLDLGWEKKLRCVHQNSIHLGESVIWICIIIFDLILGLAFTFGPSQPILIVWGF